MDATNNAINGIATIAMIATIASKQIDKSLVLTGFHMIATTATIAEI